MANPFNIFDFSSLWGNSLNTTPQSRVPYKQPQVNPVRKSVVWGEVRIEVPPNKNDRTPTMSDFPTWSDLFSNKWYADPTLNPTYNFLSTIGGKIQSFADQAKQAEELNIESSNIEAEKKKKEFYEKMLKKWYKEEDIQKAINELEQEWKFSYKPSIIWNITTALWARTQEAINTTWRLAQDQWSLKSAITWTSAYGWDVAWAWWDIIGGILTPAVNYWIEQLPTWVKKTISETAWAVWEEYSKFKQAYPNLADTLEGVVNIGSIYIWKSPSIVKSWTQKTIDNAIDIIKKPISIVKKTPEEKLLWDIWAKTTEWAVQWQVVQIPVQKKWIMETLTWPLRTKDTKVLAGKALTPSYAGKTPKQAIQLISDVEKNTQDFYNRVRTGEFKWDISTLENAAQTVISNIDDVGKKIWNSIDNAVWTVSLSPEIVGNITNVLWSNVEELAWAYKPLQNLLKYANKPLSIRDAFKVKRVFQTEIGKLIKAWDAGTDSYEALVKWVQQLSDWIDNAIESGKWAEFKKLKEQYTLLKKLASDISKSAVVEWRRSPQTLVEQLWTVEAILDGITNPLWTAKQLFAKEIGELNTRWWAWKELIKIYDNNAIKAKWNIKKVVPVQKVVPKNKTNPTVTPKPIVPPKNVEKTVEPTKEIIKNKDTKAINRVDFEKATEKMWNNIIEFNWYKIARVNFRDKPWKIVDSNDFDKISERWYISKSFNTKNDLWKYIKQNEITPEVKVSAIPAKWKKPRNITNWK